MRISDWSSDVCSSDLALHRRGVLPDICTTGEVTSPPDVMARIQTGALPISADLRRLEVDTEDDEAVEALRAHCSTRETGSESCRARVCQCVWISVVAVSLTKKHKHHMLSPITFFTYNRTV